MRMGLALDLFRYGAGAASTALFSLLNKLTIVPELGAHTSLTAGAGFTVNSDGFLQALPTHTVKMYGVRVAWNKASRSETLTNAAWVKTNATISGSNVTATAANATCLQTISGTLVRAVFRCELTRVTGTGNIDITVDGGTTWTTVGITGTTQVFMLAQSGVSSSQFGIRIVTSGDVVTFDKVQIEDKVSTAVASQVIASEYVSTNVLSAPFSSNVDGVQFFSTALGNSVTSNVLTEAVGSDLPELSGALNEPQSTNLDIYSRVLSSWTTVGAPTVAQDSTGVDNRTNKAWTLSDTSASVIESIFQTYTVADDGLEHSWSIYVLKDSNTARFPEFQLSLSGGTALALNVQLNTQTGALTHRVGSGAIVDSVGVWWRLHLILDNNASGNVTLRTEVFPAATTSLNSTEVAATGSIVVDASQVEKIEHPTSFIETFGSIVTRNPVQDKKVWPATIVNDFSISATLYHFGALPGNYYIGVGETLERVQIRLNNSSAVVVNVRRGGTNYYLTGTIAIPPFTKTEIIFNYLAGVGTLTVGGVLEAATISPGGGLGWADPVTLNVGNSQGAGANSGQSCLLSHVKVNSI